MEKKTKYADKYDVKKHSIVNMKDDKKDDIVTDPQGSYTGVPTEAPGDKPVQDADDL